jgi:hypothetical protein
MDETEEQDVEVSEVEEPLPDVEVQPEPMKKETTTNSETMSRAKIILIMKLI